MVLKPPSAVLWISERNTKKEFTETGTQHSNFCPVDVEGKKNSPQNGGSKMETQTKQTDTEIRDREIDEELADVLTAIGVMSKRLARKLTTLSRQGKEKLEGVKHERAN